MAREFGPAQVLALLFVRHILGRKFDIRSDKRHIRDAGEFTNPGRDTITGEILPAYSVDDVIMFAKAIQSGSMEVEGNFQLASLKQLWWGSPPYILRYITPPDRPSVHDQVVYDNWVKAYGARAFKMGLWDGVYGRWGSEISGLSIADLVMNCGIDVARRSMYNYLTSKR